MLVEEPAQELIEELVAEYERASETVALSYADDAELQDLPLGGELHPFQRAGVRYALERRRTFIADEQGLGKTVQALATIEADEAFPTVVVCPASMKLIWEREAQKWLPHRSVAVLEGRTDATWTEETRAADIVVLNYDILDWHSETLASLEPRALILDESHYVKNARAARTKAALELAGRLPEDALRLGLTGTPILNRAEELVSQLRVLGRLRDFGSGARLTRRFRAAGSDDRLHWNLRAHCYVRRTKKQVLPQLPAKSQDTVPVLLSNEHEYRLAERDVIAWLQTLPLDLRSIDAKVAAALRAEQLVRLNHLRQLAARGKLPTALAWIADFLESGEPLVVFAEHIATQKAVMERFPNAAHILGADSSQKRQTRRGRVPERGRAAADRVLAEGGVAGHHAHARVERGVPRARLDARAARPGRGPAAPDRPGQRRDRLVPARAGHDRRDDGRAAPAQAQPDRRGHRRPGPRRGAPRGRRRARAEGPAVPAPPRRGVARCAPRSSWRRSSPSTR